MGDHRPVPTADSNSPSSSSSLASGAAATTGEFLIEQSPPFRSNRVVLDDGRSVGLTEPFPNPGGSHGSTPLEDRAFAGWTPQIPFFLRSAWGGVGAWLGAVTVVGLAAFVFSLTVADVARDSRSSDPALNDEGALGVDVGGGVGSSGEQRASRARTTGELTDGASSAPPSNGESGRSSGSSEGLDLDLGYRSGGGPTAGPAVTGGAATVPGSTDGAAGSTDRLTVEIDGAPEAAASSTTSTTSAMSFPGSESSTTPASVEADGDGVWAESVPPGSSSVPEPGTPPSPGTLPPSITLPPSGPPTSGGPPTASTRPSVPATPPTTRRSVPADTRPARGGGQGRGRGRNQHSPAGTVASNGSNGPNGSNASNASNGRAVGRLR